MLKLIEMDDSVTLQQQMMTEAGPVILINQFKVKPENADQLIEAWTHDATFLKQQPGFISAQLHRGIAGSGVFINVAVGSRLPTSARRSASRNFAGRWIRIRQAR